MHGQRSGLNKRLLAPPVGCALSRVLLAWLASVPNAVVIPRLVKNLNRRKEGWVPVHSLQIVVGDCRFRNAKVAGI